MWHHRLSTSRVSTFILVNEANTDTLYLQVFLQVIGLSSTASAALIIPFLVTAGISGTITNSVAHKYGHARPLFMSSLALLPVGMVSGFALMSLTSFLTLYFPSSEGYHVNTE